MTDDQPDSPHRDVDHHEYESQIVVRQTRLDDLDTILEIQRDSFEGMEPWERDHLQSQLGTFPEGQIVVEVDGRVVASSSALIVDFDEYADDHTWDEVADQGYIRNHDPEGETLYGIEVMVDPDFRGQKMVRRLYDARKELAHRLNLRRIMVGGRLPGYGARRDEMTVEEYVEAVLAHEIHDPVLTAQLANGFTIKRLLEGYLDEDEESGGYAALLEWVNLSYRRKSRRRSLLASQPVRICAVQYQMRHIESFDEFAQQCRYFVDVASGYRSDFVLFPELLTTQLLSFVANRRPAEGVRALTEYTPQYLDLFADLAIRHNVNIIGGSHCTYEDDRLYNTSFLFHRDGRIDRQHKLHITPNERRWWGVQPGPDLGVFETDKGPVAINICYDIEFPEVARHAVERGARILFVPFCTDERQGYLRVRYCAQARCIENQIYVAISGTVGNLPEVENMDIQYAQSAILTPSDFSFSRDAVGAECTPNVETVVIHDVDLALLERFRQKGTVLNWMDRRRDLYEVRWKSSTPEEAAQAVNTSRQTADRPVGG
jgi:predicted amidohydrolase/ribosomal protein S18 acetylase RimI-like enzyme